MDLRIAGIALVEDATVLTANASDFEKVPRPDDRRLDPMIRAVAPPAQLFDQGEA